MIDPELLQILRCPWCLGVLGYREDRLVCARCGARYAVEDGVPNLLVEEAELHCAKCDGALTIREDEAACGACGLIWSIRERRADLIPGPAAAGS